MQRSRTQPRIPAHSYSADRVWRGRLPADTSVFHSKRIHLAPSESVLFLLGIRVKGVEHVLVQLSRQCPAERALGLLRSDNAVFGYLPNSRRVLNERGFRRALALVEVRRGSTLLWTEDWFGLTLALILTLTLTLNLKGSISVL